MHVTHRRKGVPGPDAASLLSQGHAAWVTRYVLRGWRRSLQMDDLPGPKKSLRAEPSHFARADDGWKRELKRQRLGRPSLIWSVWWPVAREELAVGAVYAAVSGITNTVGRPLFLRWTLLALDPANGYTIAQGLGIAAGLGGMM